MTETNDLLYDKALATINRLYEDTSVPPSMCLDNLEGLIEEIHTLINNMVEEDYL